MDASEIKEKWPLVVQHMEELFGKKPDMNMILLTIGIRELGLLKEKFTKEEKVKLMHLAVCRLFSESGFYVLRGVDVKGWPNWEKQKDLPYTDVFEQESLLRQHIVHYFQEEEIISF